MNILILYANYFKQLEQRFSILKYLNNNFKNIFLLSIENSNQKILDDFINKNKINKIIFFFISPSHYSFTKKFIIPNNLIKYYYILDNHNFNHTNIKNIILPYKHNIIKEQIPNNNVLNFYSRYFDPLIYKDHGLDKKYDILIYGTRNFPYKFNEKNKKIIKSIYKNINCKDFYALRTKLENILIKNKDKYNLKILTNGKNIKQYNITGTDLSKLINQSYLTVCCSSVCDFLFYKHLEIPASNSVILGDYPSDYEEDFKDNIVEVNYNMSEEEILKIIDNALLDKKKLMEKSKRMHDIVHRKHCLKNSITDFTEIIKQMN